MALSKKGTRRIVVDGMRYRWVVSRDDRLTVVIAEEDVGNSVLTVDCGLGSHGRYVAAGGPLIVLPGHVAEIIRHARDQGWDPEGSGPYQIRWDGLQQELAQRVQASELVQEAMEAAGAEDWDNAVPLLVTLWRQTGHPQLPKLVRSVERRVGPIELPEETGSTSISDVLVADLKTAMGYDGARDPEEKALLDAILAEPDEDGPRAVYADWLSERGDPRGEFIALQLTYRKSRAQKERVKQLIKDHGATWLGPLDGMLEDIGSLWRRGFLVRAQMRHARVPWSDNALRARSWDFLEALTVAGWTERDLEVIGPNLVRLKELLRARRGHLQRLADQEVPWALEHVQTSLTADDDIEPFFAATPLTHLKWLDLGATPLPVVEALLSRGLLSGASRLDLRWREVPTTPELEAFWSWADRLESVDLHFGWSLRVVRAEEGWVVEVWVAADEPLPTAIAPAGVTEIRCEVDLSASEADAVARFARARDAVLRFA